MRKITVSTVAAAFAMACAAEESYAFPDLADIFPDDVKTNGIIAAGGLNALPKDLISFTRPQVNCGIIAA